ncbi:MAG: signal peptidase I [Nocardioidaceae bacterium]|nr:signal peptidase I [Nocardioidaceae bacterium]MCL2612215.1 signal peptidase I [Nocardioidaceae bacterium]
MSRIVRIAREAALWTGGLLGALCLVSLLAGWVLHVTPLVFASGSMTPSYGVGSLGIAHQEAASDIRVGDVVSVVNDQGLRVTHRVVAVAHQGGDAVLTLRGDANNTPDGQTYRVASAPRVVLDVPYAGYVLNTVASPYGVAVAAAGVMGLLLLAFGGSAGSANRRRVRTLVPVGVVSALVVGGVAGASGAAPWAFTSAYWTDSATATVDASVAGSVDTTPPTLSSPTPADGAYDTAWSNLGCGGTSQLCVNATDVGSGVGTVTVQMLRTGTVQQCWNGSVFVSGTACAARSMSVAAGSQYASSGLASGIMVLGTYQANFTATDVAGNQSTLSVGFSVGPVISSCTRNTSSGAITISWSPVAGATSYSAQSSSPGVGSNANPPVTLNVGKNASGTVQVTAVGPTGQVTSAGWTYSGGGSNQTCHS